MVPATAPRPRAFGRVNWLGFWTLYCRGLMRFIKYAWEFLGAPAVSSLLFLAVFALAAGGRGEPAPGLSVVQFIAPGIIMFSMAHAAFEHAGFAILDDKLEGMIGDMLAAPLSPLELMAGYVLAALTSALAVGALVLAIMLLFVDLRLHDLAAIGGFALALAALFALIGALSGLWAERWEHYSMAETFLILPLGFLSGTFFTLGSLPDIAQPLIKANPVYYIVDGFRYGLTGFGETSRALGAAILVGLVLALFLLAWRLFAIGYKLKP